MIKKIRHFILSEHTNNLYKKEAGSSLGLARDVAIKLNELIDQFNELEQTKLEKIHEQDGKIAKAILYMKDNLLNTIDDLLQLKGEEMIDNSVAKHLGELKKDVEFVESRLNNLLGSITEGSTTLDSEVIDIRLGADGITYANSGESVRTQLSNKNYGFCLINEEPEVEFQTSLYAKITFKGTTHIFYNNKRFDIPECIVERDLTNDVNLFVFLICYDINTKKVFLQKSTSALSNNCIIFGRLCKDEIHLNDVSYGVNDYTPDSIRPLFAPIFSNGNPYLIKNEDGTYQMYFPTAHIYYKRKMFNLTERYVDFDYSITGIVFFILYNFNTDTISFLPHANKIPTGNVVIGTYSKWYGVSLYTFNTDFLKQESEASLILGASNTFVEFDNINKVITFPTDTLILVKGLPYFYNLNENDGNNSISYANQTSSALSVVFNSYTKKLEILQYNAQKQPHQLLLCSFRTHCGAVSIGVPYKWNGKPFNIDLTSNDNANYDNLNIKAINHRGYNSIAPENTLAAYKLSAKNGFKYVEGDVSFTSDNVPVLLHDSAIDRTSNGSGDIANLTFSQVRNYDFGSWKSSLYTGEKIPSFEEFISLCKKLGLHPYIELKAGTEAQISSLIDIVKKYGMLNNVSWISFSSTLLNYIYTAQNGARIGLCVNSIDDSAITSIKALKGNNELFINCNYANINETSINLCISENIPVEIWSLNDEGVALSLNPYISGVSSDNLHIGKVLFTNNI